MSRSSVVLIDSLKAGQIFYEVDHGVAVKWLALENAKRDERGRYHCLCQRQSGVQMIFQDLDSNQTGRPPALFRYVNPDIVIIE